MIILKRKSQIKENIGAAEKYRFESDEKIKEFEKIILDSKIKAKNIYNDARQKIIEDLDKKEKLLKMKLIQK